MNNIIIIGSWCLFFYRYIFESFHPLLRTTDIDFYIPNIHSIREKHSVISSMKKVNYDIVYDVMTRKSVFISPDGFELEFLTNQNRNSLACVRVGNTGIYAESVPYLGIFSASYINVEFEQLNIHVASPSAYVLQKLLICDARKNKKQKDMESISYVLRFVKSSIKHLLELKRLYSSIPKKWRKRIDEVCNDHDIELFQ